MPADTAPAPWTYEVHRLSEGYSAIVYDACGHRIGGLDHLDEPTARLIAAAPTLYEALEELLAASLTETLLKESAGRRAGAREGARRALALARGKSQP